MEKIKLRLYILENERIRRVGLDSQGKRKFTELAGKNALLVELILMLSNPPVILKIGTTVIDFDDEGKWYLDSMEMRKVVYKSESIFEGKEKAPSNVVRFLPQPKISSIQRELLKSQVVKEFGIATWNVALHKKLI